MRFSAHLNPSEREASQRVLLSEFEPPSKATQWSLSALMMAGIVSLFLVWFLLLYALDSFIQPPHGVVKTSMGLLTLGFALITIASSASKRINVSRALSLGYALEQPFEVESTPSGLLVASAGSQTTFFWHAIQSVEEKNACVYVRIRPLSMLVLPDRAFPTVEFRTWFIETIRSNLASPPTPGSAWMKDDVQRLGQKSSDPH